MRGRRRLDCPSLQQPLLTMDTMTLPSACRHYEYSIEFAPGLSINLKKAILKKAGRKSVQFLRQIPAGKAVLVTVPLAAGPFRVDDFRRSGSSSTHRASAKMVYPICKIVNSNTTYTVHSQENRSRRPSGKAFKTAIWKSPQEGHQDIISPQEG